MTDTPTPPQTGPEGVQSAPQGSGSPELPPQGSQAPQKAVEGSSGSPRPLADAELLAWSAVMTLRGMQQRRGQGILLRPFPPCPDCQQTVTEVITSEDIVRLEQRLTVRPCGHGFTASGESMYEILEQHGDLVSAVEETDNGRAPDAHTWTTDDIVRTAHDWTGRPGKPRPVVGHPALGANTEAATQATDICGRCPACRGESLMLAAGGHVTCRRLDCPNPNAADQLLRGEPQTAIAAAAAREEEAARLTPDGRDECRAAHSGRAAGLRDATRILGGHDGPTITECAANDRNWDVEQGGE
ncbi:hypothetical protein ABZ819_05070 [Streptomyces venezuelae]|uniref:hypothetical protein n=1 Tax=Streptomyces venezuelae TaxID=54571 RepID=UPI00341F997B